MNDTLVQIGLSIGAVALALWLERKHAWCSRLSSALLAVVFGYILSFVGVICVTGEEHKWVVDLVVPISLICALLSCRKPGSFGLTPRLMWEAIWIMLLVALCSIAAVPFLSNILIHGHSIQYGSVASLFISMTMPKNIHSLFVGQKQVHDMVSSTTILIALVVSLLLPVLFRNLYRTVWLYVPIDEANKRALGNMISYDSRSGETVTWGLAVSISMAILIFTSIRIVAHKFPTVPMDICLLVIPLILGPLLCSRNAIGGCQIAATLGSHIFLFFAGATLASKPWHTLLPSTLLVVLMLIAIQAAFSLLIGYRLGVNIETICVTFLALTCGPLVTATACTAKRWDPLLFTAFLLGFLSRILIWILCMLVVSLP